MSHPGAVFLAGSLILIWISRASLAHPGSHGFYRFFAWEAILALFLMNRGFWFRDPFAWYQLISWLFLLVALFLVIHGIWLLRQRGVQDAARSDAPLLEFEKTTVLVTQGAYRYIRHPLYSSLFFLTWGIFFKLPSLWGALLALIATALLVATARAEEREDLNFFGAPYREYMRRTKMFIPYLF
ncbi:MAG TPA: isoprenylcysteine carboxylmethyltransferase family protein [Anaerolineaceae bacterium]|nr:isoprenylcysteine carboxylmethyltransferase family protein [Anaerolineaceae bacterium]